MFRLASLDLSGRRILVVEDDDGIAARMAEEIAQSGGVAIGPVGDIAVALALIERHSHVDCAMLDVRYLAETEIPVIAAFKHLSVEVVFVTGFDDWFLNYER